MLFVKDMSSPVCATIHLLLQGLNAVVLLLAIVVTSLVMSASFGTYPNQGFPSNITFMTTTFYSARTMDLGYGWPIATERQEIGVTITNPTKASAWAWDHYYECMYSARLGDAQCNPANSGNPTGYVSCLTTNNVTQSALGNCSIFSNTYNTQWPTLPWPVCLWEQLRPLPSINVSNRACGRSLRFSSRLPPASS